MNVYTRVLEFFMENGVQLNMEQMEDLKAICETRAHGYTVMKASEERGINSTAKFKNGGFFDIRKDLKGENFDKVERYTREIDILNNKLNRGEISEEEFNNKVDSIYDKAGDLSQYLSRKGSQSISDKYYHGRPKDKDGNPINNPKDKDIKVSQDTRFGKNYSLDDPTEGVKEKIDRHYALANSTDDPRETLKEKDNIKKYANIKDKENGTTDIRVDTDSTHGNVHVYTKEPFRKDQDHNLKLDDNEDVTHMSDLKNIQKLKPSARSKEGIIYDDERVYATIGKGQKANESNFRGNVAYKIDPKDIKDKPITRSDAHDIYISTDKPIDIKKDK